VGRRALGRTISRMMASAPAVDVAGRDASARVVVLSCHIRRVFDASILSLALFALRRYHPTCKVVLVDNSSPIPITQRALPAVPWMRTNVAIVLNSPSTTREYGAYAKGLAFLAGSVGEWSLERHEQFVFMQGSIILTQPVPAIGMEEESGRRCVMKPLYVFDEPNNRFRGTDVPFFKPKPKA
jgi:hypothetical protein